MRLDLKHAQRRYFECLKKHVASGVRWLDLGCGHQIVPAFAATAEEQRAVVGKAALFAGVDLDPALSRHPYVRLKAFARGEQLPFAAGSFDLITANMVVEHLEQPDVTFAELRRVLAIGGKLLFHTPNLLYPYVYIASHMSDLVKKPLIRLLEKREEHDVFPTHYRANTVSDIRMVAERAGLGVEELSVGGSVGSLNKLGPLGIVELPFLKALTLRPLCRFNTTILAVLTKADSSTVGS